MLRLDDADEGMPSTNVFELGERASIRLSRTMPETLDQQALELTITVPDIQENLMLHLWQIEDDRVSGGYTLIVRLPDTIDNRAKPEETTTNTPLEVEPMNEVDPTLAELVIKAHPGARAVYEITEQLARALPIDTRDALLESVGDEGLTVLGETVHADALAGVIPEEAFPVRTESDLVEKVVAAVAVGTSIFSQTEFTGAREAMSRLARKILVSSGVTQAPAAGLFEGPSLFGGAQAKDKRGRAK
jgi:hypothetical protein